MVSQLMSTKLLCHYVFDFLETHVWFFFSGAFRRWMQDLGKESWCRGFQCLVGAFTSINLKSNIQLGVSKNRGGNYPPKWMVKIVVPNPMNKWMIWGVNPPPYFWFNTQLYVQSKSIPQIAKFIGYSARLKPKYPTDIGRLIFRKVDI